MNACDEMKMTHCFDTIKLAESQRGSPNFSTGVLLLRVGAVDRPNKSYEKEYIFRFYFSTHRPWPPPLPLLLAAEWIEMKLGEVHLVGGRFDDTNNNNIMMTTTPNMDTDKAQGHGSTTCRMHFIFNPFRSTTCKPLCTTTHKRWYVIPMNGKTEWMNDAKWEKQRRNKDRRGRFIHFSRLYFFRCCFCFLSI